MSKDKDLMPPKIYRLTMMIDGKFWMLDEIFDSLEDVQRYRVSVSNLLSSPLDCFQIGVQYVTPPQK